MKILFWISIGLILYVYIGYPIVLFILAKLKRIFVRKKKYEPYFPGVTIVIAALNEESHIKSRILNCLELDYPAEKLEILIGSDGSSDRTVEIANRYRERGVVALDFKENRGRATVHNDCIANAKHGILLFTDAETVFEKDFLQKTMIHFQNPKIGCVVGKLLYKTSESSISQSEGTYLKYEIKLKKWESDLGIMTFGIGACMAIRKALITPLKPIDDVDFTSIQDCILQNKKVLFESSAIAYDSPPSSVKGEYKSRIRITSKNLAGTVAKWKILNWFKHPFAAFSIISHRILKWFTPYFMILAFISNILIIDELLVFQIIFGLQVLYYLFVLIGYATQNKKIKLPMSGIAFSFFIASAGMFVGVLKGIFGMAPASYVQKD
jgi:poly-beta-1,6-N-acetyl-D-glucosamine synthase